MQTGPTVRDFLNWTGLGAFMGRSPCRMPQPSFSSSAVFCWNRRRRRRPPACTRCSPPLCLAKDTAAKAGPVAFLARAGALGPTPRKIPPKPGSPHHGGALAAAAVERWPPNPPVQGPASFIHRSIHRIQSRRPRPHHRELTVPPAVPHRSSTLAALMLGVFGRYYLGRIGPRLLASVIASAIEMQRP